jgi:hypothetical protein
MRTAQKLIEEPKTNRLGQLMVPAPLSFLCLRGRGEKTIFLSKNEKMTAENDRHVILYQLK